MSERAKNEDVGFGIVPHPREDGIDVFLRLLISQVDYVENRERRENSKNDAKTLHFLEKIYIQIGENTSP